ncbi:hypothetical protein [Mycobacterium haemophilum]
MALTPLNRALNLVPKRAEKQEVAVLHATFVNSGVADVLDVVDHQVLYGRRGTGKTHALSYLGSEVEGRGDIALNIDLRTLGSPDGLLAGDDAPATERAARLLIDLLGQLHNTLLDKVLNDETLLDDDSFVTKADAVLSAITTVQVSGDVETSKEVEAKKSSKDEAGLGATLGSKPRVTVSASAGTQGEDRALLRETRKGREKFALNFSDIARALRELAEALSGSRRIWLLLDEWSSVPADLQPYLAEFLVRCVLPLQRFTVKIAAIEQHARFMVEKDGRRIGIEIGADMGANVNLDDFLVYEGSEEQSRAFFKGLLYQHLRSLETANLDGLLSKDEDVIRKAFTDRRAFDELVRASEGVPRDALYIAGRAAMRAGDGLISVPIVRDAARWWFQTDKSAPLAAEGREGAQALLAWVIERVIRGKKARAFLVNEKQARDPLLRTLFDARVLHIVRRGYSAQDEPGERYDVWVIDYGAYVGLLQTQAAPEGALPFTDDDGETQYVDVDVPLQDLRAIRRAILDPQQFYERTE